MDVGQKKQNETFKCWTVLEMLPAVIVVGDKAPRACRNFVHGHIFQYLGCASNHYKRWGLSPPFPVIVMCGENMYLSDTSHVTPAFFP